MEAMALESLVLSVWRLDGYLGMVRHPVRLESGRYSDLDVVAVRADGRVRIAECKATGPARRVYVNTPGLRRSSRWESSLFNVRRLWESRPSWLPTPAETEQIDYYLVGNIWFEDDTARGVADARLTSLLQPHLPEDFHGVGNAFVRPSRDLLLDALTNLRRAIVHEKRGKRYGDPLLDAMRELIRYANPQTLGGDSTAKKRISEQTKEMFIEAIFRLSK